MRKKTLLLSILLGILGITYCYMKSHPIVLLDPSDSKQLVSEAIIDGKEIKVPGYRRAFNPSILEIEGGYLMSFRVRYDGLYSYIKKKVLGHSLSFIGSIKLDDNFNIRGKATIFDPRKMNTPEDARLCRFNEKIYLFFNDFDPTTQVRKLYLSELVDESGSYRLKSQPILLNYPESGQLVEKNWSPFLFEEKLCVVYSISPHLILEVNPETGECDRMDKTDRDLGWHYGEARGGTPCLLIDGHYLSFFHSSKVTTAFLKSKKKPRAYFMGAYSFESRPPFSITKITQSPLARKEDYKHGNRSKVIFPGGMIIDGNKVHVIWGRNDSSISLSTFDKEKLMASMSPCD